MRSIAILASGLALFIAAGCGGNVETEGHGGGGSGGTGGTGGTGGQTGGTGGTGTGGACAAFADEAGPKTIKVTFRNETTQPIYLPSTCSDVRYEIKPQGGDDGTTYVYDTSCLQTCEELQTGFPFDCGACPQFVRKLPPFSTYETTWDGTRIQYGVDMPDACWFEGGPSLDTCSRILAAAPGKYNVLATGYAECGPNCECGPDGLCNGEPTGLTAYPDITKLDYPGNGSLEVVFSGCAFGCPDQP